MDINTNRYVAAAVLFNETIKEMRAHVEYEKFLCRMLIDNDTTRDFKQNTEDHSESIHRFIYNNKHMDKLTEYGKYETLGQNYKVTESGVNNAS